MGRFYPSTTSFVLDQLDNPYATLIHINTYRKSLGQSEMKWDESLCKLASERIKEIPSDWSHSGFEKRAADKQMFPSYCPKCTVIGEDLAKDFFNEQTLVNAWINSPTHLKNIIEPFKNACIVVNNGYAVLESSY